MQHLPNPWSQITAHLFPAAWLSSLWRCSSLVWPTQEHWKHLELPKKFFVPLDSTPTAEVIKAQKATNLLGVSQPPQSCLKPPTLWDGSWNFTAKGLKPSIPKGQEFRALWLFKGLFSFSRTISKGRCFPKTNGAHSIIKAFCLSSQNAIKLPTGHESGTLKQYKQQ